VPDLKTKILGPTLAGRVASVQAYNELLYVAVGAEVLKFSFLHLVAAGDQINRYEFEADIHKMLLFGEHLLVLLRGSNVARVRSVAGVRLSSAVTLEFVPTDALHPTTYLNKVLFASDTSLALYNVNTSNLIFSLNSVEQVDRYLSEGIQCMQQSPVVDVIAVATRKGHLAMIDIKKAQVLKVFKMSNRPTCLSFSTDYTRDPL